MKNYVILFVVFLLFMSCGADNSSSKQSTIIQSSSPDTLVKPKIVWHWKDPFTSTEQLKVKKWIKEVFNAVENTLGIYPFSMHVYIHRVESANEPVPWAHTSRGKYQSVHFHINTDYEIDDFLHDWTAPHEISHLSIPFVGRKNAWFSEGYATYMQYQIMHIQGVFTADEITKKYQTRLKKCVPAYQTQLPVPAAADSLKAKWNYPDMYWGGVSFFYTLNAQFEAQHKIALTKVIKRYEKCCRVDEDTPENFVRIIDSLAGGNLAKELLYKYQTVPAYVHFEAFK